MTNRKLRNILFPACVVEDGFLYAITETEHIWIKIDVSDGSVELVDNPNGYEPQNHLGTDRIIRYKDTLIALEMRGNRILQYSASLKQCEYIKIDCGRYVCNNFAGCYLFEERLFIIPSYINEMVIFNLKNREMIRKSIISVSYQFDETGRPIPTRLFSCSCRKGNDIWIFTEEKQIVVRIRSNVWKYNIISHTRTNC